MNDFTINQQQSHNTTIVNLAGHGKRGRNDSGADFSSFVSKASNSVNPEKIERTIKSDADTKPAEELVAYAAAAQAANNPSPSEKTDAAEPVTEAAAVSEDVYTEPQQETLESVIGEEDLRQVLDILGIEIPEDLPAEYTADFAAVLTALIDAKLGEITDSVQAPVTPEAALNAAIDSLPLDAALRVRIAEFRQYFVQTAVAAEAQAAAQPAAAEAIEQITAVAGDTAAAAVQGNDETVDADTEEAPKLNVVKSDDAEILSRVKAKLETHIAAQQGNDTSTAETPQANTEVKPVTEAVEAAEVQTAEAEEPEVKTEVKKTDAPRAENISNFVQNRGAGQVDPSAPAQRTETHADIRNIIDQIVQSARMSRADGLSQLEIQLRPAHLGKVSIVFTSGDDGVSAQIKAHNDVTRAMLGGGLGDLMSSLKDMGINMKNINVSEPEMNWDYTRGSGQQQQQFGRENQRGNNSQERQGNRILRVNSPSLAQISTTLYGTAALQPIMDENVSVDFIA